MNQLFSSISKLFLETDESLLSRMLASTFNDIAQFDSWMLLQISSSGKPKLVDFQNNQKSSSGYVELFKGDPFYKAICDGKNTEFITLSEIEGRNFRSTSYYKEYFKSELGISDQIGYLCPTYDGETYLLTLGRSELFKPFRKSEIAELRLVAPLVRTALLLVWARDQNKKQLVNATPEYGMDKQSNLLAHNLKTYALSPRERETLELLLVGNSAKVIGRTLGISHETARCHIKKVYLKLGVSSRGELFGQFVNELLEKKAG